MAISMVKEPIPGKSVGGEGIPTEKNSGGGDYTLHRSSSGSFKRGRVCHSGGKNSERGGGGKLTMELGSIINNTDRRAIKKTRRGGLDK